MALPAAAISARGLTPFRVSMGCPTMLLSRWQTFTSVQAMMPADCLLDRHKGQRATGPRSGKGQKRKWAGLLGASALLSRAKPKWDP